IMARAFMLDLQAEYTCAVDPQCQTRFLLAKREESIYGKAERIPRRRTESTAKTVERFNLCGGMRSAFPPYLARPQSLPNRRSQKETT
ncbi:MAG: hypothetical protein ACKVQT_21155, partial [Burkholderiales bacterium]